MLADRLKIGTVAEMMARLSAEEYVFWKALSNVESREAEHRKKTSQPRSRRR